MKRILLLLLFLYPSVCLADSGDETLNRWLDSADLVFQCVFENQSITSVHELIVHHHHFDVKVSKVIKGEPNLLGETVPVQIVRFERDENDRNSLLKKGETCILFLKNTAPGDHPYWTSSDMWFSVQPSFPSMLNSLSRLATTKTEHPAAAPNPKSESIGNP